MAGLRLSLADRRGQECPLPSSAPTSSAFLGHSLLRLGWYAVTGEALLLHGTRTMGRSQE